MQPTSDLTATSVPAPLGIVGLVGLTRVRAASLMIFSLLAAAGFGADEPTSPPEGMILVPAGEFTMGSNDGNFDEAPVHRVRLSAYYIDKYEVTLAEFAAFVRATDSYDAIEGPWFRCSVSGCVDLLAHYEQRYGVTFAAFHPGEPANESAAIRLTADTLRWKATVAALRVLLGADGALADQPVAAISGAPVVQTIIKREQRLPACLVTWHDATAFAHWAGKRLPTEAEWEKAARGADGRTYPWGSEWDATKARAGLDEKAGPVAVGSFPQGASPYGCFDLAGNVWEWCDDWYGEYYYGAADAAVDPHGPKGLSNGELPRQDPNAHFLGDTTKQGRESDTRKVIRGGCWAGGLIGQTEFNNRCARRQWSNPNYWSQDTGFRCARDAK